MEPPSGCRRQALRPQLTGGGGISIVNSQGCRTCSEIVRGEGIQWKCVPEGHPDNSPAFQRRDCSRLNSSPEGTAERNTVIAVFQPSLRDFIWGDIHPSVEFPKGIAANLTSCPRLADERAHKEEG